jgi:hypothetical protein
VTLTGPSWSRTHRYRGNHRTVEDTGLLSVPTRQRRADRAILCGRLWLLTSFPVIAVRSRNVRLPAISVSATATTTQTPRTTPPFKTQATPIRA